MHTSPNSHARRATTLLPYFFASVALALPPGTFHFNVGTGGDFTKQVIQNGTVGPSSGVMSVSISGTGAGFPGFVSAEAQVSGGAEPIVSVSCQDSYIPNVSTYNAAALSSMTFFIEVHSTTAFDAKLRFTGSYFQNVAAPEGATATLSLHDAANNGPSVFQLSGVNYLYFDSYDENGAGHGVHSGNIAAGADIAFVTTLYIITNRAYSVNLSVQAGCRNQFIMGAATLDPLVILDPSHIASHPGDYLEFTKGFDPCPADLNHDGQVDDADFSIFVVAYDVLDCADPSMPADCPADINGDTIVDDADFSNFVVAYNALLCP